MKTFKQIFFTSIACLAACCCILHVSAEEENSVELPDIESSFGESYPEEPPGSSDEPDSEPVEDSSLPSEDPSEDPEPSPEEPESNEPESSEPESEPEPSEPEESSEEPSEESSEPESEPEPDPSSQPESREESSKAPPTLRREPFSWLSGIKTVIPADRPGYISPKQQSEIEYSQRMYEESRAAISQADKADRHILSTPPLPSNEVSEDTASIAARNESSSFLIGIIIWSLIGIVITLILIFVLRGNKTISPFTTKKH